MINPYLQLTQQKIKTRFRTGHCMPLITKWPWFVCHKHEAWAGIFGNPLHHLIIQNRDISGLNFYFHVVNSGINQMLHFPKGIRVCQGCFISNVKLLQNFTKSDPMKYVIEVVSSCLKGINFVVTPKTIALKSLMVFIMNHIPIHINNYPQEITHPNYTMFFLSEL